MIRNLYPYIALTFFVVGLTLFVVAFMVCMWMDGLVL